MVLLLSGLRVFQKRYWDRSLDQYAHASLAPLTLEEEREGDNVRLLLPQTMTALQGHTPPGPGEVASFYLAARFKGEGRTVSFQLLNTNPIFTRPCQVVLQGEGLYFFPVYDYDFDPPFTFLGIELSAGDRPFFEGLYLVENGDSMRLWPYVFVPEDRLTFAYYKTGRLDRGILGLQARARGGFGLYPETSRDAFLSLIPRHPFHDAFAEHALWYARRCGDKEHLIHTWETIGAFMPEWRSEAGEWLTARAEEAQRENNPGEAIRLYEKAGAILPENLRYRERAGELQEGGGEFAAARTTYKSILRVYPENASVAYRLHALSAGQPGAAEYASFWEELVEDFPRAAVPRLYCGMVLEERGDIRGALEAYAKIPGDTPVGVEADLRRGMLLTKEGAYEEGVNLLHFVATQHPEYSGRVENVFLEVYLQLKEREDYGAAVTMYEILSALHPDRPDIQEKLAGLYELSGDSTRAIDLYEQLLQQKTERASPAKRLDVLYAAASSGVRDSMTERAVTFWSALAGTHPDTPLPYVYLGAALERRGETAAAQEAYRNALVIAPGSAEALYRSGALEVSGGAVDVGLAKMREAAAADAGLASEISRRCDQIAAVLVAQQQHETALRLYQTALEISPQDLWPRVHQGELYERMGDEQAAAGCYRDVMMAVPESPVTAKLLDRLLRQAPSGGKTVVEEWRAIVQRHPEAAIPAFYLGKALESAGDRSGAADYYGRAIQWNSALSEAAERLRSLETQPPDQ
ncbi:MAG: tetratricopeptide repeat protein [Candidatus Hydrogenedentes bacterium ADurb.Bin101]|nr:MAG: tetratricopeptide repeat protein [Candidatus Hydrogenedentes bacterium ADurb.Bin101]